MEKTAFAAFMKNTLSSLAELFKAPQGTFLFSKTDQQIIEQPSAGGKNLPEDRCQRIVTLRGSPVSVSLREPEDSRDLVLRQGLEEVGQILEEASGYLDPDQKENKFFLTDMATWCTEDVLAERIASRTSKRIFEWGERVSSVHLPYISLLAEMFYESDKPAGTIAFLKSPVQPDTLQRIVRPILETKEPIRFERRQLSSIRKRFAGVGEGGLLFVWENNSYVLRGYIHKKYLSRIPVSVEIKPRGNWFFRIKGREIFGAKGEHVYCTKDLLDSQIKLLAEELGVTEISALEPAIRAISEQKHGTSVVFLNLEQRAAKEKMEILASHGRAVRIKGLQVTNLIKEDERKEVLSLLRSLTRVDGSLVIDYPKGVVAYGEAILDGDADHVMGDGAAGARRNVVSCFVANMAHRDADLKAAALMFSENGEIRLARTSDYRQAEQDKSHEPGKPSDEG